MRFRWRERAQPSAVPVPAPSLREGPEVAFAEVLLDEGREELDRADSKASLLLGGSSVALGAFLGAALGGEWTPGKLHYHPATEWVFWIGVTFAAFGVFLLAWAVLPRTRHVGDRHQLAYFGHVVKFRERGVALRRDTRKKKVDTAKKNLTDAICRASAGSFERTVDQVWTVSMIVQKKYRRIRYGLFCYGIAAVLCTGAVITYRIL